MSDSTEALISDLRFEKKVLEGRVTRMGEQLDALLAHCDKDGGECMECSRIICPHQDPLHFHHDGCPSCAEDDQLEGAREGYGG